MIFDWSPFHDLGAVRLIKSSSRNHIISIIRVASPLNIYFAGIFYFTLIVTHRLGYEYKFCATKIVVAASSNFELPVQRSYEIMPPYDLLQQNTSIVFMIFCPCRKVST